MSNRHGLAKLSMAEIALLGEASPAPVITTAEPEKKVEERARAKWDAVNKVWNTRLVPKVSDKYVTVVSTLLQKVAVSDLSIAQDTVAASIAEKHASLGAYNTQVYFCGDKGGSGAEIAAKDAKIASLEAKLAELISLMQAKA